MDIPFTEKNPLYPPLLFQSTRLLKFEIFGSLLLSCLCCTSIYLLGIPLCGLLSARLVAMYIAVAIRPSSYVHRLTLEVALSFLPEVVAQI